MGIYTEVIVCIFLVPIIGIVVAATIIGVSIPITLFSLNYYKLTLYKKLREEIGAIPFWSGWIITKNGDWHYIDFGVVEKEEILIKDEDVQEYENQFTFKEVIEKLKAENENLKDIIDDSEFNDEFVDKKLDREYRWIGLSTSRQIYAFEMIRAFFDVNDQRMSLMVNKLKEIIASEENAKNEEEVNKLHENLSEFETILLELSSITSDSEYKPSNITEFLETKLTNLGVTDKIAYNTQQYKNRTLRLTDVEHVGKSPEEVKKNIRKSILPLFLALLSIIITMILILYIRNTVFPSVINNQVLKTDHELGVLSLIIFAFIPMILSFVLIIKRMRKTSDEENSPMAINFNNVVTKRVNFDNYCEMRHRLKQYASDARIYKIFPFQKYRKVWDSDHIIVVLPSSYEDSMTFDIGSVSHRGYPVEVLTTPYVMLDIGTMYGNIPMYLMIACPYIFKRFTKIFYNYNLLQNWKNKTYLYLISQIQSRYQILEPEKQTLKIQVNEWQNWAITQVQLMALSRQKQDQELSKSAKMKQLRSLQGQEEEPNEEPNDSPQLPEPLSKRKNIAIAFLIIAIIVLAIILLIPFITKSLVIDNTNTTNSTTTPTTTTTTSLALSLCKSFLFGG